MELHKNKISIEFELRWRNRSWNGPQYRIEYDNIKYKTDDTLNSQKIPLKKTM